ncbi:MAG TPA: glycosyltransferase family 4 protein [Candidatus Eisenbacteria bacterium]|nr:glycosyltransferase family 4 protein [Candidatus Eisenbacteria bacterium]
MSRILLSAYACEPGKGSEPEVGWLWATELEAAGHDVWVLTRDANRQAIETEACVRHRQGLHFVYYDLPRWPRKWKRGNRGVHWYYALWQWGAYRVARRLAKTVRFDCVQHVTFVGVRAPSFMGGLGLPFFLGPVSGGESVPCGLRAGMSWRAKLRESVRDVANWLVHADPVMRAGYRRAKRILVATPESRRLIPRPYLEKCAVQLGVGLSREYLARTRQKRSSPGDTLRLLYAGRLLEWKGVDLALHAVKKLRERGVAAHFTVVGDGPAQAELQCLASQLGVDGAVRWLAWTPHDQLHEHYYAHDALLFPSLRDSGGMVVLEALAHGLPVVCTDRGGPGVIVNDRCGRVVQTSGRNREDLADALADALHQLSRDQVLTKSLSAGARTRAWEFDFRNVVERVHPSAAVV